MLICLYPPYYARCSQFFPFQHLQLSGLLQLEEGGINAEFVGAAVLEDVINIYTAGKQLQITNNILRIQFFIIHHIIPTSSTNVRHISNCRLLLLTESY